MTESTSLEAHGPASVLDPPIVSEIGGDAPLNRGGIAWSIFEGGRDPYVILMTIYIFMPYVASVMVGDAVKGQAEISSWQSITGYIVMVTAPFLGASVDKLGPRKGLLGLTVAAMVPLIASLWWARPDASALSITATFVIATAVNVLFTWNEVLHNSMLIRAAGLGGAHKASGLALSLGNFVSVLALGFTAWAFALPGKVSWGWVPAHPLFGLNPAAHEPDRVVALLSAGILAVGAIPLFLFTPDAEPTGVNPISALGQGARELLSMLKTVRRYKDAVVYLFSRMIFADGMNGVLFFAGVYAVGVMKWTLLDLLIYGIILSVFAVFGGFVGRWLDARVGPKNALRIEISMTIVGIVSMLGLSPTTLFYVIPYDAAAHPPLWNGPVFRTLPDWLFLAIGFNNAIFITGQYASARTTLTRLTPPEQTGAFFGVYALAGVATYWLAPTLVNIGTRVTGTQQGGFATIVILLVIGLIGLAFVQGGGRARTESIE
jgi:UMF1 family MFS transporter